MAFKYFVTGAPRGATHYISYLLTACQLYCGHESVFDFTGDSNIRVRQNDWIGDASYIGAPFSDPGIIKIHWMRDPLKTIASLVSKGWLENESLPFVGFISSYAPAFTREKNPIARAARFYVDWHELACSGSTFHWYDASLSSNLIFELAESINMQVPENIENIISMMPKNISPRMESEPKISLSVSDIPSEILKKIKYPCC